VEVRQGDGMAVRGMGEKIDLKNFNALKSQPWELP
jgi:hypothetical protein